MSAGSAHKTCPCLRIARNKKRGERDKNGFPCLESDGHKLQDMGTNRGRTAGPTPFTNQSLKSKSSLFHAERVKQVLCGT